MTEAHEVPGGALAAEVAATTNLVYTWGPSADDERKQWAAVGREGAWLALKYMEHAQDTADARDITNGWNNMGIHLREIAGTGAWWAANNWEPRP